MYVYFCSHAKSFWNKEKTKKFLMQTYVTEFWWLRCAGWGWDGRSWGSSEIVGSDVRWNGASGCGSCPGIRLVCWWGQRVEQSDRSCRALQENNNIIERLMCFKCLKHNLSATAKPGILVIIKKGNYYKMSIKLQILWRYVRKLF